MSGIGDYSTDSSKLCQLTDYLSTRYSFKNLFAAWLTEESVPCKVLFILFKLRCRRQNATYV